MSATSTIQASLAVNGWKNITASEPDFFGDVRIRATHAKRKQRFTAVIANTGTLAGVYIHPNKNLRAVFWHGTRVADATRWIATDPSK